MSDGDGLLVLRTVAGTAIFCALHGVFIRAMVRARQCREWPTTTGTVEHFEIRPGARSPNLFVRYRYVVAGREYTSTRYRFEPFPFLGASYVRELPSGPLLVGAPVAVHYHPRHPDLSTLETGVLWEDLVFVLIYGVGGLLVGGIQLITWLFARHH